jgi:hypothetical protein
MALAAQPRGIELQDIPHANAHVSDAGLTATLLKVVGDAGWRHGFRLSGLLEHLLGHVKAPRE